MAVGRTDHGVVGALEQSVQADHVGCGAAHHKPHVGFGGVQFAGLQHQGGRPGAVGVFGVAHGLLGVGAHQSVQDERMGALGIVVAELVHGGAPLDGGW